jgi:hypothetical protein
MAGSHVRVTRFSSVHAHSESGYVYQSYSGTGFRCCNPGARYPYTPSAGGPRGALRMDCEFPLPCAQQRGAWRV